ncbi:hypothetical protein SGFS_061140 [Streptomyces graminofaciens]|uniref:Uncharacterized protein n=1 Tax=Streptomyces graminofaciens TaxID=68212 RepID=A0ABN5VQJ8_9ACTN|nr:hypothetical protein SGFS_061140 [Streptomyces graminofaciens]
MPLMSPYVTYEVRGNPWFVWSSGEGSFQLICGRRFLKGCRVILESVRRPPRETAAARVLPVPPVLRGYYGCGVGVAN